MLKLKSPPLPKIFISSLFVPLGEKVLPEFFIVDEGDKQKQMLWLAGEFYGHQDGPQLR